MTLHHRPKRYVLVAFIVLVVAAGTTWSLTSFQGSLPLAAAAENQAALSRSRGVACFGYVDLENGVTSLYPLQPGRVAEVLVREGDKVEAGAVLLRLEDRQARLRVNEAQAARDSAQEQLNELRKLPDQHRSRLVQQEAAVEVSRRRLSAAGHVLARKQEMVDLKLVNAKDVTVAADQVQEAEAGERAEVARLAELKLRDPAGEVRKGEKDLAMIEARLEQARQLLEECSLKASKPGTVMRVMVGPGDVLSGQPQQPALLFCPDGPRFVRAEVEQEFASRVTVGAEAMIEDDVNSGAHWRGKVIRIAEGYRQRRSVLHEPSQFNDVRTLECLIDLGSSQTPLRLGQRVRVMIGKSAQ